MSEFKGGNRKHKDSVQWQKNMSHYTAETAIPVIARTCYRERNRGFLTAQPVSEDVLTGYE